MVAIPEASFEDVLLEDTEEVDASHPTKRSSSRLRNLERFDSRVETPVHRRRALSVITVETADLDCQFTRADEVDKMIEEEKSEKGRVSLRHQVETNLYVCLFSYNPLGQILDFS